MVHKRISGLISESEVSEIQDCVQGFVCGTALYTTVLVEEWDTEDATQLEAASERPHASRGPRIDFGTCTTHSVCITSTW